MTGASSGRVLIFLAAYNESGNARAIHDRIRAACPQTPVLWIEDRSPDGTGAVLDAVAQSDPLTHVIHRSSKGGVGSAHREAIDWAYRNGFGTLVTLDADGTHRPEDIPAILRAGLDCDVVVGSRFVDTGSIAEWSFFRRAVARISHYLTTRFLGMPQDATSAFRLYRLDRISPALWEGATDPGYGFFFESMHLLSRSGASIREVAIHMPARAAGHSKMTPLDAASGLALLARIWCKRARIFPPNNRATFFKAFAAVFCLRLLVVFYAFGTNDVIAFKHLAMTYARDWLGIYHNTWWATYPPAGYWLSLFSLKAAPYLGMEFGSLLRLFVVAADSVALYYVWKLLRHYGTPARKTILYLCLLNPVNFVISSFHCQLDPLVMAFVLASIYFVETGRLRTAGLLFGAGLTFKIFPLLLAPAFVYFFARKKDARGAAVFFALSGAVLAASLLPYLLTDPAAALGKIFLYNGWSGYWGLTAFLRERAGAGSPAYLAYAQYGRLVCLFLSFAALWVLRRSRLNLCEACFVCGAVFFAATPSFFWHYLSWITLVAMVAYPLYGSVVALLGGALIVRIYGNWCGWEAPWYSNAWLSPIWTGKYVILDRVLWATLLATFLYWMARKLRVRGSGEGPARAPAGFVD